MVDTYIFVYVFRPAQTSTTVGLVLPSVLSHFSTILQPSNWSTTLVQDTPTERFASKSVHVSPAVFETMKFIVSTLKIWG